VEQGEIAEAGEIGDAECGVAVAEDLGIYDISAIEVSAGVRAG